MSKAHRDLVLSGSSDLEPILREVFRALASGRELPTVPTETDFPGAFSYEATMYLTENRDGLTMTKIIDYGEFHAAVIPSLVVGEISVESVGHPRGYDGRAVLRISANAEVIEHAAETVKRIALANGFAFVKWGTDEVRYDSLPGPPRRST